MSDAAIERREVGDALSQIVGTGDTRAMLEQVERNVRTVVDVARARGYVRRYGDNQHEFYGEPAWSLLGMTYGLVPFIEWTRPVDNGWEARAVARTREGVDVSSAEAMCTRTEQNRRGAPDHTLRAMAQTRARRNALRSALGAALVLAGFDFADPDQPATPEQVKALWTVAGKHGWNPDEAHERAGVDSMKDLTREQAAELLDEWSELAKNGGPPGEKDGGPARPVPGEEGPTGGDLPSPGAGIFRPITKEQFDQAKAAGWTQARILARARKRFGPSVSAVAELSADQFAELLAEED